MADASAAHRSPEQSGKRDGDSAGVRSSPEITIHAGGTFGIHMARVCVHLHTRMQPDSVSSWGALAGGCAGGDADAASGAGSDSNPAAR